MLAMMLMLVAGDVDTKFGAFTIDCVASGEASYQIDGLNLYIKEPGTCGNTGGVNVYDVKRNYEDDIIITTEAVTSYAQTIRIFSLSERYGVKEAVLYGGDPTAITVLLNGDFMIRVPDMGVASRRANGMVEWECEYTINFRHATVTSRFVRADDNTIPISVCSSDIRSIPTSRPLRAK